MSHVASAPATRRRCSSSTQRSSTQRRLAVSILPELVGKGGLRAQIRGNGVIAVGEHNLGERLKELFQENERLKQELKTNSFPTTKI